MGKKMARVPISLKVSLGSGGMERSKVKVGRCTTVGGNLGKGCSKRKATKKHYEKKVAV